MHCLVSTILKARTKIMLNVTKTKINASLLKSKDVKNHDKNNTFGCWTKSKTYVCTVRILSTLNEIKASVNAKTLNLAIFQAIVGTGGSLYFRRRTIGKVYLNNLIVF